ncbi:ABC transporter substrate-binding protein [Pseudoruegeria sp. SK021]|uniref:ABC transporter substrate-binding protein n=1 Tax=Pseudoruegeria sp. SK021 TaxID=1933035 RepID=UPI00143E09C7|nr:ABC transporter substrate-binding protein [Pseudoruegeria sp. SK021]
MTVEYYASDMGPEFEQSARALADDWGKLGLELQLVPVQFSTFVTQYIVGGQLEDLAVFSVGADPDRVDPTYWVYDVAACGLRRNGSKWCDEAYSQRASDQRAIIDQSDRIEAVHALQEEFVEAMPFFTVVNRTYGIVYNSSKWENVTSPEPVAAHEELVNPWLAARPLTDDRWLDWAYFEDVSTYNPLAEESAVGWVRFIFDTFAKNNSEGKTVPWAAESWTWIDDTTLEVTLREGMLFHDGEAVTADDAVYTINTVVDLQPPAMSSRTSNITGAEKIDDLTFRISLNSPDAAFEITVLTYMFILPEHIWSNGPEDLLAWDIVADDAVIGSGPFKFKTWLPNEVHELDANADHFQAPEYDGLRRLALGQADAIRAALLDGTGDIATSVLPVASMDDLARQNDFLEFIEVPSHGSVFVWMNNEKAPFNDRAFRMAIRKASNKQRVMIEGWQGFAVPASEGPVPRVLGQWYNSDLEQIAFDIDAARQELEDAGYGWGSDGALHFPVK